MRMSQPKGYTGALDASERQIRLLTILPSFLSSSIVKCELSTFSLDSAPLYDALSYVWGSPENPAYIELDKVRFPIGQNLHAALKALRHRSSKYVLWVDAVCINQKDVLERNSQVSQMRFIYETAQQVTVWLGDATSGSSRAFGFLKTFASQPPDKMRDWLIQVCEDSSRERDWSELAALFKRSYWTRAWIYQEMIIPRRATIHCGKDYITWGELSTVVFAIDAHENLLFAIEPLNASRVVGIYHPVYNAALGQAQRQAMGLGGSPELLSALCTQRYSDATDPRDKVYSLLGVTKNFFLGIPTLPTGPDVVIDYNLPLAEVYKGVVRHILRNTRSLDILCACQNPERAKGIPSWAPDWSVKRTNGPIQNPDQWSHIHFACKDASIAYDLQEEAPDQDTLVVNGVFVDSITQVGMISERGSDWEEVKANWIELTLTCGWNFSASGQGVTYITLDSIPQAFFETVTVGRIPRDTGSSQEDLLKVELARIEAIEMRRFFVTEKGFMGLGPEQAKVGDKVVAIQGVHVPMVLREEKDRHLVVGESFVHGLNDGEAFNEDMRDGMAENMGRRWQFERFFLI